MDARDVVGANVRALRDGRGLSQEALAREADLHPSEVSRAERGGRDLRVSTIVKLARGLNVEVGELLRGVE